MNPKTNLTIILFCLGAIILSFQPAFACGCGDARPSKIAFQNASAVFIGKVDKIQQSPFKTTSRNNPDGSVTVSIAAESDITVSFSVKNSYKRINVKKIDFIDSFTNSCAYRFTEGSEYLIYAFLENGNFKVSKCNRTRLLSQAGEDIKYIERLEKQQAWAIIYGEVLKEIVMPEGKKNNFLHRVWN